MTSEKDMTLQKKWFDYVKNGQKVIEGRLKRRKFANFRIDDEIEISNDFNNDKLKIKIVDIKTYQTFEDFLKNNNIKNILPNIQSIEEGLDIYNCIYSKEEEKEFGIIAIFMKLL